MRLDNIRIVLVEPIYGGNVGAVCRAMANMGLSRLALVAPKNLNLADARTMACHAADVLDARREFATLQEAVADCGTVFGTTCREGLYRRHSRTPREWASKAVEAAREGQVALVFGREDNGLSNEELALCMHIIRIPSSPAYKSLNVAQAAMICFYEIFLASGLSEPRTEGSPEASADLRERMCAMWREMILKTGFVEENKADHMMYGLRRIFGRGALTVKDVNILMGVARQALWAAAGAKGRKGGGSPGWPAKGAEGREHGA